MRMESIVPGRIWHAQQGLRIGPLSVTTRATFVKLADGSVWVHSPISPTPELQADLAQVGPVRYVVAPNRSHHLFFAQFLEAFPQAHGYVAPGLAEKRPDLAVHSVLDTRTVQPWSGELSSVLVEGLPVLNETVWFHDASGTLIITDLLFCFGPHNTGLGRLSARLLGVYGRLGMSRAMKFMVKDRAALARTASWLLSRDVRRIVLGHDQIIEHDARDKLTRAFEWIRS